jgi:type VI secretion system protein ImpJ
MPKLQEVNWAEGMFLRPQHLQLFSRYVNALATEALRRGQTHFWGVSEIEADEDQLASFPFSLVRLEVVLKDGTRAQLGSNLHLDPRGFKTELERREGGLPVHFGVPILRNGEANVGQSAGPAQDVARYRTAVLEAADENRGGTDQQVEIRQLNGHLFFGGEDRTGYECVPIALIQRPGYEGSAPVLDPDYMPPLVRVAAWPPLRELADAILNRVEATCRLLRTELYRDKIAPELGEISSWQSLFKLQIVGSFLHVLRQLGANPDIHPFDLYLELARLAGELSIFYEEGAETLAVPAYDPDRLGHCFRTVAYTLEKVLEEVPAGRFIRVPFAVEGEVLIARLEEEWLGADAEVYLGVDTDLGDRELMGRIEMAKFGAPLDIEVLKQRRLFGLDIQLLARVPAGLPSKEGSHYFSIRSQGPYWEAVARDREVAISGGIDPELDFALYIVRKRGGTAAGSR